MGAAAAVRAAARPASTPRPGPGPPAGSRSGTACPTSGPSAWRAHTHAATAAAARTAPPAPTASAPRSQNVTSRGSLYIGRDLLSTCPVPGARTGHPAGTAKRLVRAGRRLGHLNPGGAVDPNRISSPATRPQTGERQRKMTASGQVSPRVPASCHTQRPVSLRAGGARSCDPEAVETGLPIAVDAGHDTLLTLAVTLNGSPRT